MKQEMKPDFIIIDDDYINNSICLKMIRLTFAGANVQSFIDPEIGLEYIRSTYSNNDAANVIVFLDINMPVLTGWDILERFKAFSDDVKGRVKIFILSSSVNPFDEEIANNNQFVSRFITKPLSKAILEAIIPDF